jgi:hypothetical protein
MLFAISHESNCFFEKHAVQVLDTERLASEPSLTFNGNFNISPILGLTAN